MMKKIVIGIAVLVLLAVIVSSLIFVFFNENSPWVAFRKADIKDFFGVKSDLEYKNYEEFIYQIKDDNGNAYTPSEKEADIITDILYARLQSMGIEKFEEVGVTILEGDKISVKISPDKVSEDTSDMICATGTLEFIDADGNVILDGSAFEDVRVEHGVLSMDSTEEEYYIGIKIKDEFIDAWGDATEAAALRSEELDENGNPKNYISIVFDGEVVSSPSVSERIESKDCVITGDFTEEEVRFIVGSISSGALPVNLERIQ